MEKLGKERCAGEVEAFKKGFPEFLDKAMSDISSGGLSKSEEAVPLLYAKAADRLGALSRNLLALIVEYWKKQPHKDPRSDAETDARFFTDTIEKECETADAAVRLFIKKRRLEGGEENGREYLEDSAKSLSKDGALVIEKLWREADAGLRVDEKRREDWLRMVRRETRQLVWACLISAILSGSAVSWFFMQKAREDAQQIDALLATLATLHVNQGKLVLIKIKTVGQIKREINTVETALAEKKARIEKDHEEKLRKLKIRRAEKNQPMSGKAYDAAVGKLEEERAAALKKAEAAAQDKIAELNEERKSFTKKN